MKFFAVYKPNHSIS